MPIYEYRCESCGAELEKIQKISDPPLRECPECGREALVKLVSASSFRLKGSGWYETDFKTGKKKNGVGESSADSGGSGADSKPVQGGDKKGDSSGDKSGDKAAASTSAKTDSKSASGSSSGSTASK